MSSGPIARQWFVPGEGIDRHVISADIQRYLGNDATVRPGLGNGSNENVQGYWIKAYRNLTNAMIADLKQDSARWRQEQRSTGTRGSNSPRVSLNSGYTEPDTFIEPYVGSAAHNASVKGRPSRPPVESPGAGGNSPYRMADSRSDRSHEDRMDVDTPAVAPPGDRRYGSADPRYPQENRVYSDNRDPRSQPDARQYPSDSRDPRHRDPREQQRDLRDSRDPRGEVRSHPVNIDPRYADPRAPQYHQEQPMAGSYGRPPVTSSFQQDPRYPTASGYPPASNDGPPPGFARQGNYYVPVSQPPYENSPAMRMDSQYPPSYGAQQTLAGGRPDPRDPRDMRGDPRESRDSRYPPEYPQDPRDPRYAYPSPAATISTMSGERPITSPPAGPRCDSADASGAMGYANARSPYAPAPQSQYEQYGRRKYS
ncbi:hypothetical protein MBLNU230_g6799t2 [Neophaeotheca triangularis]